MSRPGHVRFTAKRPRATVLCKLGKESATGDGGVGGWITHERPGRPEGIEWGGLPIRTLTIPILLDGLATRRSIEPQRAALDLIGRPPSGSSRGTPPPVLTVEGMVPHGDREWVLTGLDEGEAVWDGRHRIRLWATVTLTEHVALDTIKVTPRKKASPATRTITVKRGQTLGVIARDVMGAKTATAIAKGVATIKKLNGIRDAKSVKPGRKLKVPK